MELVHFSMFKPHRFRGAGISKFIYGLSSAQAALGYSVTIAYLSEKDDFEVPPGVKVKRYRPHPLRFFLPRQFCKDAEVGLAKMDFGHLHCGYLPEMWAAARFIKNRAIPYTVTPHAVLSPMVMAKSHRLRKVVFRHLFQLPLLNSAAFIHALSSGERKDVMKYGTTARIKMIPQGFDISEIPESLDRSWIDLHYPLSRQTFKLVFMGRIDPVHKGLDLLVDALAQIKTSFPEIAFSLFLIGSNYEGGQQNIEQQIARYGVSDQVLLTGSIHGVEKYHALASADLFVHPSRWEGMPFSLIEAFACGVPCLVTPGSNAAGLVARYDAGFVAEPTVDSIKGRLIQAIRTDPSALRIKGRNAKRLAQTEFSWETTASLLCAQYEQELKRRGKAV